MSTLAKLANLQPQWGARQTAAMHQAPQDLKAGMQPREYPTMMRPQHPGGLICFFICILRFLVPRNYMPGQPQPMQPMPMQIGTAPPGQEALVATPVQTSQIQQQPIESMLYWHFIN